MNKKRLVAFGLGSLSLLGLSSFAMTLAWYGSGYYNSISPIEISLRAEPKLFISTSSDKSSFTKTDLSKNELKKVDVFHPVSSMYSDKWIARSENYPKFVGDFAHIDASGMPSFVSSGFYSQDLYLYSEDDIYVTFDKEKLSFTSNEKENAKTAKSLRDRFPTLTEEQILNNLNAVSKSLRVSVLAKTTESYNYYIYDPYKQEETLLAGILDTNIDQYFDFNEQSKEIVYGEYQNENKIVYQPGTSEDVPYSGLNTCFNAKHKAKIAQFDLQASKNNGFIPAMEKSLSPTQIEDTMKIPVKNQQPTHIVLSIYLEGWDKDNTNLVEYGAFNADIQFKIKGDILWVLTSNT